MCIIKKSLSQVGEINSAVLLNKKLRNICEITEKALFIKHVKLQRFLSMPFLFFQFSCKSVNIVNWL